MNTDIEILEQQIGNDTARELGPLKYLSNLLDVEMDKIINWFLLLIIFVFDPLAISMVVAANFAFNQIKPKNKKEDYFKARNRELERRVECSLPEGAEWNKMYYVNDSFDPADVDELQHWEEDENVISEKEKQFQALKMRISQSQAELQENEHIKEESKRPSNRGNGYWY